MGRPPIGKVAMTGAERVRRYRLKHRTEKPVTKTVTKPSTTDNAKIASREAHIRELEAELARERARHEELPPLSKSERLVIAAYKRQIKSEVRRELEAQFEQRANAAAWELLDYNIKLWLDQFRAAEQRIKDFDQKISRSKPIMSKRMFRMLVASVQPDKGGTHELAVEFNTNRAVIEAVLCGSEAEQRKWALPSRLPRTREELDAARAKVQAENSARAKRAAATRAAKRAAKQSD